MIGIIDGKNQHEPINWSNTYEMGSKKVLFIPKVDRANYNSMRDFRPISVTSVVLKMVERLVDMSTGCSTIKKILE